MPCRGANTGRNAALRQSFDHQAPLPKVEVSKRNIKAVWSLREDLVVIEVSQMPTLVPGG
jgi:hypothetical protein